MESEMSPKAKAEYNLGDAEADQGIGQIDHVKVSLSTSYSIYEQSLELEKCSINLGSCRCFL